MPASPMNSQIYAGLFGDPETERLFSDSAELRAMLLVEGELARVQGKLGLIPPDVPTMAEFVPGFEATTWFALFAPANVPKPVIDKLNAEVVRVFRLPDVQDRLKTLGLDPVLSSPEELARYQAVEITKWAKVVKESGAKAE